MAEGILKSFDSKLEVFSAGTKPAESVNPLAIKSCSEIGIDISKNYPKNVELFLKESFDYVITVCDSAKEICPIFIGEVKKQIHIGFDDPYEATGTIDEQMLVYRRVRDEIFRDFRNFYNDNLKGNNV